MSKPTKKPLLAFTEKPKLNVKRSLIVEDEKPAENNARDMNYADFAKAIDDVTSKNESNPSYWNDGLFVGYYADNNQLVLRKNAPAIGKFILNLQSKGGIVKWKLCFSSDEAKEFLRNSIYNDGFEVEHDASNVRCKELIDIISSAQPASIKRKASAGKSSVEEKSAKDPSADFVSFSQIDVDTIVADAKRSKLSAASNAHVQSISAADEVEVLKKKVQQLEGKLEQSEQARLIEQANVEKWSDQSQNLYLENEKLKAELKSLHDSNHSLSEFKCKSLAVCSPIKTVKCKMLHLKVTQSGQKFVAPESERYFVCTECNYVYERLGVWISNQ